jgi:hypothetical protein
MSLRTIALALAAALSIAIVWAGLTANFWESFGRIIADPWGIVTLLDLYIGFIVASVLIYVVERGRIIAWVVIVPMFFLGNVITALWLAWRATKLLGLVSRQPDVV